ncbi:MAG: formate--tetrahydrofolate ligase [Armatimonadetes bacterium]|nr:formate--tetrahydrofolate ligase [Armatimonadota bacterium]
MHSQSKDTCLQPIAAVAQRLGLAENDLEFYGRFKAKISPSAIERAKQRQPGKLVVVTAITPTPAGEGKTTVAIGLSMALSRLGKKACVSLREPSLGPLFGMKGGATGGGKATVEPAAEINLHFTGDLHAVTAAQNLLAAFVDNHFYHGNALGIDPDSVLTRRCLDVCDRSLRHITVASGNGGRESSFELTAACELMATLTFSQSITDLKERVARIIIGFTREGKPVTVADLKSAGVVALLRDAIQPNLAQTSEGTPALIHLGPFGNVGCGCNSVRATQLARQLADYTITEAGFASDLGFEKFCDLICRAGGFTPDAAVVVATVRALKYHGGVPLAQLGNKDSDAVANGFANLQKHIENVQAFGLPCVVALNQFSDDRPEELAVIHELCAAQGIQCVPTQVWQYGSEGGLALAAAVMEATQQPSQFRFLYDIEWPLERKLETIAGTLYGAEAVELLPPARQKLAQLQALGLDRLPLCVAKTHLSLSDNARLLGRPSGFTVTIKDLRVMAGAGFIVCYAGNILTMPGLPLVPAVERIEVTEEGRIIGMA